MHSKNYPILKVALKSYKYTYSPHFDSWKKSSSTKFAKVEQF